MTTGIYEIVNKVNGKTYIGSSVDIEKRWKNHLYQLKRNKHHSKHLQNAYNKHGRENFDFRILEHTAIGNMLVREQFHMDDRKSYSPDLGYNICPSAGNRLGVKASDETKKKISERKKARGDWKGNKNPGYGIHNFGEDSARWGMTHTAESRERISENHHDVSGENNPNARLTMKKAREIRNLFRTKQNTTLELAEMFSISRGQVYMILQNKCWSENV